MSKIRMADPIALPAVDGIEVSGVQINVKSRELRISLLFGILTTDVIVRDGDCVGVRKNNAATDVRTVMRNYNLDLPDGYTRIAPKLGDLAQLLAELQATGIIHTEVSGTIEP